MSEKSGNENQESDTSRPLYSQADVEAMVTARLIEFGYPLRTQARKPTVPSSSEKGKGLEVVNPVMIENIAISHTVPLGKTKVLEEMTDVPMVLKKGTPTIEEELRAMKEEMKRMSNQLKAKNNHDF